MSRHRRQQRKRARIGRTKEYSAYLTTLSSVGLEREEKKILANSKNKLYLDLIQQARIKVRELIGKAGKYAK